MCSASAPRVHGLLMSTLRPTCSPAHMPMPRTAGLCRWTRARAWSSGIPDTHWATGTMSDGDVALMTPDTGNGVVTPLDWAGLDDIGWITDQLVVTDQPPQSVAAGAGFGLTVAAEDPDGQVDTVFNGPVTLALGNNPGGGTLGGTLTATAVNGVATFSGLSINQTGDGYTLLATSTSLPSVTTTTRPVNVTRRLLPDANSNANSDSTPTPTAHDSTPHCRRQHRRPLQRRPDSDTDTDSNTDPYAHSDPDTYSDTHARRPLPRPLRHRLRPPPMIIGEQAMFRRKLNKKGKPGRQGGAGRIHVRIQQPAQSIGRWEFGELPGGYRHHQASQEEERANPALDHQLQRLLHRCERLGDADAHRQADVPDRGPDHGPRRRDRCFGCGAGGKHGVHDRVEGAGDHPVLKTAYHTSRCGSRMTDRPDRFEPIRANLVRP